MKMPPEDPRRHFADKLVRLQRIRGLSDQALAARAKLDQRELDQILRADTEVPLDSILLLAGALEVEPADLLDGLEWCPDGEGGGEYRIEDSAGG